jgi:DNA polymerase-1
MERIGISVNTGLAESELSLGTKRMREITSDLGGLNASSPKDLEELLTRRLGLPIVRRTNNGAPSFDKYAMEEYELLLSNKQDPTAQNILEYRGWQKACSTYFEKFLSLLSPDGRLRPNFKLHGTRTGRLSCETPNLQQIPRTTSEAKRWGLNTKKCISPMMGFQLWELDYSNLELRLAAIYSGQDNLIQAFNTGQAIWDYMSELLGGWEKSKTKTVTYATLYGAGTKKLSQTMGVSLQEAKKTKKRYFDTFPRLKWASETINDGAKEQGYVSYWTGRRRHFPATESTHKAFNSVLQGGGAEVVKRALVEISETVCDEYCRLVLTVHDSIVLEIRKGYEAPYLSQAKRIMETIPTDFFEMMFTVDAHVWGE